MNPMLTRDWFLAQNTAGKGNGPYISSHDALLGHHEDEADEDGRAQHADGAHQGVGPLCLLATQACGGRPDDHAQQSCHAGDRPKDHTSAGTKKNHLVSIFTFLHVCMKLCKIAHKQRMKWTNVNRPKLETNKTLASYCFVRFHCTLVKQKPCV